MTTLAYRSLISFAGRADVVMSSLVATSGYGPTAFEFANGKPLELVDGANLLYLLAEHAGPEGEDRRQ